MPNFLKVLAGSAFIIYLEEKMDKEKFKEFYAERSSWRNPKEEEMRLKKATKLAKVPKGARVLDIGCRDGSLKNYLEKDVIYYGIDIASEFKGENIIIQDISEGTNLESHFFDYVFCIDVLEHVKNPFLVLNEINRILKKEGVLILSVPNPYHFKEIIWNLLRIKDRQGHIFSWTRQTMQRLAEFCGFRLLEVSGTYLIPPISCNNLMTRSNLFKFQKVES